MRVAAYYRVSTEKQDLDNQKDQIRAYCKVNKYNLVYEYEDVESGASGGRNGLSDCLRGARARDYDILIVVEMSRLTRKGISALFSILQTFRDCGVTWISLREPYLSMEGAAQDLLISILAWANKLERDLISQRTRAALKRRKAKLEAKGLKLGRPKGSKDKEARTRTCWKKDGRVKMEEFKKAPPPDHEGI